jgi:hypothetical protein
MKDIIILGEEYWFGNPEINIFKPATVLLEELIKNKDPRYNYILLKNPGELIPTIKKTPDIKGIFLFQDVISDSYLNNMNIFGMKKYLYDLKNKGIYIYPPIDIIDIFASKNYNMIFNNFFPYAALPKSRVVKITNYNPKKEEEVIKILWKNTEEMFNILDKVVIKKGYSYEGKQVKIFTKSTNTNYNEFKEKAKKLNYKRFWNRGSNSMYIDNGADRHYLLQGYNKIVSDRKNEYRFFFHNGKIIYISNGTGIPNVCIADAKSNPLIYMMKKFAKKIFKDMMSKIWHLKRKPILFRVDVSYAEDDIFQDEHSINIEGFNKPIRLYINELEIDPTNYFYNKTNCKKNEKITSEILQKHFAKCINKFIKKTQ